MLTEKKLSPPSSSASKCLSPLTLFTSPDDSEYKSCGSQNLDRADERANRGPDRACEERPREGSKREPCAPKPSLFNQAGSFSPPGQRLLHGSSVRALLRLRSYSRRGGGDRAKSTDCSYSRGEDDRDPRYGAQRRSVVLLQKSSVNTHISRRARVGETHERSKKDCHSSAVSIVHPLPALEAPPRDLAVPPTTAADHYCETRYPACARGGEVRTELAQAVDPNEHWLGSTLGRGAGLGRREETNPD